MKASLETREAIFVTWLEEMRAEHQQLPSRIDAVEARLSQRMDDRFSSVDERLTGLHVAIADVRSDLMKGMLLLGLRRAARW